MSRVAALAAIALAALVAAPGAGTTPGHGTAPDAAHAAPARIASSVTAPAQQAGSPARIDVDAMTPRVVTGSGPAELVVSGTVTNTGDTPLDQLSVRVQRGPLLSGEPALRTALAGDAATDDATPAFTDLGPLAPGASTPFRYSVPLAGAPAASLALPGPGTYPLLLNLNGAAGGGPPSRLASVRTLLPVSSVPGAPAPPRPPAATPVSMLYPITDAPRRIPPVPGQPTVLTDDSLAASFAPGGRLRGLVGALESQAPAGSPVRASVCLAVDPELVATAQAMSGGYQVQSGPDGATVPGTGADAARTWLDDLSGAARGGCLVALPPADADLVALVRGGQADLARTVLTQGRTALSSALDTTVQNDLVWPVDGVLDEPTLTALGGGTRLALSSDGVGGGTGGRASGVVRLGDRRDGRGPDRAVLTDPLLTEAATGPTGPELQGSPAGALAGQDLSGALAFRASRSRATPAAPLVVAPPHGWTADGDAATGVLSSLAALIGEGRIAPAGLAGIATGSAPPADGAPAGDDSDDAVRLFYPPQAGGAEIPDTAVQTVAGQVRALESLRAAAESRTGVGATPAEVFDPLVRGTMRGVSSAWRGDPARAGREVDVVADRVEQIRSSVRVLEPPSPYSLGTSDAPLLITVANGLPVTMNVRVVLAATSGLRVDPIEVQAVPPLGRVQVRVNAQVTRAGQFSVDAGLRTPDGAELGPDTRLRVRSTVYGTVTVWLTAVAGAVLVVLVVRRIVRRLRPGGR
ncbi:DUF6049 family protein [Pseudonocardia phyllosphaerae]|uniref:DUF6049 family protein n=1 Tax=Pseudonocardia phyllosphaerae TaxID=3390502 RepID=UPI00397A8412